MSPWITEISPLDVGHRHALQLHMMGLSQDDRHVRFGLTLSDSALVAWIQRMDWGQAQWWGAWADPEAGLLATLQLTPTQQPLAYELALTVNPGIRHQGVATALLKQVTQTLTGVPVTTLVCENGHPAVLCMAATLGFGVRLQEQAPRVWLDLPAIG